MPFVNVKLLKDQVSGEKKKEIISGLTDLVVKEMNRSRELTNIIIDEIAPDCWALNGKQVDFENEFVSFVNIKVSKGTTNEEEMNRVIQKGKQLMENIFDNHVNCNYFIIDELNPGAWGFGDVSMLERARQEG